MIPISLDAVKLAISSMSIETELKKNLVKNAQTLIEFRTFLTNKYSISDSKAESMIKEHLGSKFTGSLDEVAILAGEYAKTQGFESSDNLQLAVQELLNFQKSLLG